MRLTGLILGLALLPGLALLGASASVQAETRAIGVVAGAPGASETELAAEMASLFPEDAGPSVLPMTGDTGAGNLALLLSDPSVDIAFVSADALAAATATQGAALNEKLELVARLYPQEVHVLARGDIASLADLAGKRVSIGPEGSGSAATAASLFKALSIQIEPLALDPAASLEQLQQGTVSAAVIVGGKPVQALGAVPPGLHLLPIPFEGALEAAYLPTRLGHDDYPGLIAASVEVPTIATGLVLLAAKAKHDAGHAERVAQFIDTVFPRFAELKARDKHPKWRDINLAATWPGLTQSQAAAAWSARQHDISARPATPSLATAQGLGTDASGTNALGNNEKEALFEQFMQWQRAKGH